MNVPRMSATERLILDLLADQERFGLELVDVSAGSLKRGTVYVTLQRMQQKRYVESRVETMPPGAIGLPRRLYKATPYGVRVLAAWRGAERTLERLTLLEA